MNNIPGPLREPLSRASIIGAVLGVFAIILFIILWIVLGQAGISPMSRLLGALCVPPAVIAAIIGGYILIARPNSKPKP